MDDLKTDIEMMRENNDFLREALPDFVMKQHTITAGDSSSKIIVCDTHDLDSKLEGSFHVIVSVDNEQHTFTFTRGTNK